MEVTKAVKAALNTLVDIASHSLNGKLVPIPEIAKRQDCRLAVLNFYYAP